MVHGIAISAVVTALRLVVLHGPDGHVVEINPEEVVTLREPRGQEHGHFHSNIKCLVFTADGKYLGVTESCATVEHKLMDTLQ